MYHRIMFLEYIKFYKYCKGKTGYIYINGFYWDLHIDGGHKQIDLEEHESFYMIVISFLFKLADIILLCVYKWTDYR